MFNILRKQAFGITDRLRKRDFSGNTGLAVKNSIYSFSTTVISKLGSIIFLMLLTKKLLSVELFGLYSLALSTIMIFTGFSDLGITAAIVRYISKYNKNARGYIKYLTRLKLTVTFLSALALLASAYFIANHYYQKPIFLALLAGALYIVANSLLGFVSSFFQAENDFKTLFFRESLFQIAKLILVPLAIILTLVYSTEVVLFSIFISISLAHFIALLFLKVGLKKYKGKEINQSQKKEVARFVLPLSLTILSGVFFGYIDMLMLGRFVESIFIAYYQAAFSLLTSAMALISFGAVLFPIFSRLKGVRLLHGLKKSIIFTIPLSILGIVGTIFLAPYVVRIIFNANYLPAVLLLQVLSILFLIDPLIGIFSSYYLSIGRTSFIAFVLVISTALNITLNIIFILYALSIGGSYLALLGAVAATIMSRFVYLGLLMSRSSTIRDF